jgi:hypothetical protein
MIRMSKKGYGVEKGINKIIIEEYGIDDEM